ncbi:glutamine amidotransferase-related protein [Schaalia suimastitidis]|uniref:glutamine amidotransferase-related protein n=1 Tax=Schaalia suimastitidis TaxID=121163 RepID=UPI00040EE7E9|nr:gamma-glutamyl-gamma-aminobutyrate hydrolase family protein [Schaalia suimastitidis]
MSKPFLMLSSRADEVVFASEAEALPRLAGLNDGEWVQIRMERYGLPVIDLNDWSGIIVCGSPFDAGGPLESKSPIQREVERGLDALYPRILDEAFPFLGICYGLGTLNVHLGGVTDSTVGEEISAPILRRTAAAHNDPLLEQCPDTFHAYVGHHEGVVELAPGLEVLLTGEACPIQMVRAGERAWATQFHPELDLAGVLVRVDEYGGRYYAAEKADEIRKEVSAVDTSAATTILSRFVELHRR